MVLDGQAAGHLEDDKKGRLGLDLPILAVVRGGLDFTACRIFDAGAFTRLPSSDLEEGSLRRRSDLLRVRDLNCDNVCIWICLCSYGFHVSVSAHLR